MDAKDATRGLILLLSLELTLYLSNSIPLPHDVDYGLRPVRAAATADDDVSSSPSPEHVVFSPGGRDE
ncbi:hypothetical protein AAHA92_09648 [Salvia divinorum]|uniref:Uncharacterized protein n=1 Tax=Salvia divinorum TaxID=28513 RepID=A0ABD1HS57_SALDI